VAQEVNTSKKRTKKKERNSEGDHLELNLYRTIRGGYKSLSFRALYSAENKKEINQREEKGRKPALKKQKKWSLSTIGDTDLSPGDTLLASTP